MRGSCFTSPNDNNNVEIVMNNNTTYIKWHESDIRCLLLQAHQQQLQSMRVPESLWRKLHNKVRPRIGSVLTAVANHTVQRQPLTLFLPLATQVKNEIFDSG